MQTVSLTLEFGPQNGKFELLQAGGLELSGEQKQALLDYVYERRNKIERNKDGYQFDKALDIPQLHGLKFISQVDRKLSSRIPRILLSTERHETAEKSTGRKKRGSQTHMWLNPGLTKNSPGPRSQRAAADSINVRLGVIGRANVGKTALFHAMNTVVCGASLPSHLEFAAGTAKAEVRAINESVETNSTMRKGFLDSTQSMEEKEFFVYNGSEKRIRFSFREVIGQILTNPEASEEVFAEYQDYLSRVDVLWLLVPCPPRDSDAEELRKFDYDLRLANAHLREALDCRRNPLPLSVAIIISKLDTYFNSSEDLKNPATLQALKEKVLPLVNTASKDPSVENVWVFPISALGFGNTEEVEQTLDRDDDFLVNGERVWRISDEGEPPFNVTKLVVWSLVCGMLHQDCPESDDSLAKTWESLVEDLDQIDGAGIRIKDRLPQ